MEKAVNLLSWMDQQGHVPSVSMYRCLLKACAERKALVQVKQVEGHLAKNGLQFVGSLGEHMVCTLVNCGDLEHAIELFLRLPRRTVFSWTAMISGYTASGQVKEALRMYRWMLNVGVQPSTFTFVTLLKACSRIGDLAKGKHVHAEAIKYRYGDHLFVQTSLVDMYGSCGSIGDAWKVFSEAVNRNVVLWNVMLAVCSQHGQAEKCLLLYEQMLKENLSPDARTAVRVLQACGKLSEAEEYVVVDGFLYKQKVKALTKGKIIHAFFWARGYGSNVFVCNTLVSVYGKCGSILDAQNVFEGPHQRSAVSWNALLVAHVEQGEAEKALLLYETMLYDGVSPTDRTFVTVLQACGLLSEAVEDGPVNVQHTKMNSLQQGKALHAAAWKKGYGTDVFVSSSLINMYSKCFSIKDARNVFDHLCEHDLVSWTAMLMAYVESLDAEIALHLYVQMQEEGMSPDACSFAGALQACSILAQKENVDAMDRGSIKVKSLGKGKTLHADAWRKGYGENEAVTRALISMYRECGSVLEAQIVFDGLAQRDVLLWNAMLAAYADQSRGEKALEMYEQMQLDGVSADICTFLSLIQLCSSVAEREETVVVDEHPTKARSLVKCKAVHAAIQRRGFDRDLFVDSALVSVYGKCQSISDAQIVFDGMPQHDVVSWNAILMAYVEGGASEKVLQLFKQMQLEGLSPDEVTTVCILQASSNAGSLALLRHCHMAHVHSADRNLSPFLASALITAYGKCANMGEAQCVFDSLLQPDVVTWNALISAYARQGDCMASIQCYDDMQLAGSRPDGATFRSLLSACSHAGLVDKGVECFESMLRDHGVPPDVDHYASMVDLFGRAGCFSRIYDLLSTMPMEPNLSLWLCLLGACQKHGKVLLAEKAFVFAVQLEPKSASAYVLMSNIYEDAGLAEQAQNVRKMREGERAWKNPGQTWIGHEQEVHTFLVGDRNHTQNELVYGFLGMVSSNHLHYF